MQGGIEQADAGSALTFPVIREIRWRVVHEQMGSVQLILGILRAKWRGAFGGGDSISLCYALLI